MTPPGTVDTHQLLSYLLKTPEVVTYVKPYTMYVHDDN